MNWKKAIRALMTALTLALAAALCAAVLSLYADGLARRQAAGSSLTPLFTREMTAAALGRIAPLALAWLTVLAAAVVTGCLAPARGRPAQGPVKGAKPGPAPRFGGLRAALYAAALLLLILGIFNGGLNDVLVKAINICTECIGLG